MLHLIVCGCVGVGVFCADFSPVQVVAVYNNKFTTTSGKVLLVAVRIGNWNAELVACNCYHARLGRSDT